ncbi:MAG: hypothetical protein R3F56_00260 [Planctomycetota bacterium]
MHRTSRAIARGLFTLGLAMPGVAQKISIWVDDAHTSRIQVDELDPKQIADPSSFSLGGQAGIGHIGIAIGWSREQGIEYDKKAQQLIDRIRDLCTEFNKGELSLETYQRRVRQLFNGIEAARLCSMEIAVQTTLEANQASRRLDEALGLAALDDAEFERRVTQAMASFRGLAEEIAPNDATAGERSETLGVGTDATGKAAVSARMADLDAALRPVEIRSRGERKLIEIWKDKSRTTRIAVPMLDVEGLVQELEQGLCLQMRCSLPLVSVCVGSDLRWTMQAKARYDEAAQVLIVKYRKLCLEYNSCLLSQEEYFERLVELMEIERRAFATREELHRRLDESKAAMAAELDKEVGSLAPIEGELGAELDEKRRAVEEIEAGRQPDSVVAQLSAGHRADMRAWDTFVASVGEFHAGSTADTIEVYVDDERDRKIVVPRLDTDIIAVSVRTRLGLHICFFSFGPEFAWTRQKGLDYGHAAQLVIIKSKRLCMDYNAGLLSQESYLRRSRQIDAALDKAAEVRQGLMDFYAALRGASFARAERMFEREKVRVRR